MPPVAPTVRLGVEVQGRDGLCCGVGLTAEDGGLFVAPGAGDDCVWNTVGVHVAVAPDLAGFAVFGIVLITFKAKRFLAVKRCDTAYLSGRSCSHLPLEILCRRLFGKLPYNRLRDR